MHFNFIKLCIQKSLWFHFGTIFGWPSYPKARVWLLTTPLLFATHSWLSPWAVSASCQTSPVQFTKATLRAGPWETESRERRWGDKPPPFGHFTICSVSTSSASWWKLNLLDQIQSQWSFFFFKYFCLIIGVFKQLWHGVFHNILISSCIDIYYNLKSIIWLL